MDSTAKAAPAIPLKYFLPLGLGMATNGILLSASTLGTVSWLCGGQRKLAARVSTNRAVPFVNIRQTREGLRRLNRSN